MVDRSGLLEKITSLSDLQQRCRLQQTADDRFFTEWRESLPNLHEDEQRGIDRLKRRYDYHRMDGLLLEGTINLVVVSPLLELAGFVDPPFRIRSPYGLMLELEEPDETVRGFIDTLVVQEKLWILVVESKRTSIAIPAALPQLLAYISQSAHSATALRHGN